ncbi:MAG: hypothetical protein NZL96_01150 [Patescibacteria group bacterium]|nr:hypothetical protein [Patescibacteria group bacterium]
MERKLATNSYRKFTQELDKISKRQETEEKIWQNEIVYDIKSPAKWFFFCPLSDVHIGSKGVNHKILMTYVKLFKVHPIYTFFVGDLGDFYNPNRHPYAMHTNLLSPDEQLTLVKDLLKSLEDKCLGLVSGNHEDFVKKSSGIDVYKIIHDNHKIPLLKNGGILELNIDRETYRIKIWHRIARLNSQFNPTHAGKQALRLSGENIDLIISADKHQGAVEQFVYNGEIKTVAQLGTFKIDDSFGRDIGMVQKPTIFFPVFAFCGLRKEILVYPTLESAIVQIKMIEKLLRVTAQGFIGIEKRLKRFIN